MKLRRRKPEAELRRLRRLHYTLEHACLSWPVPQLQEVIESLAALWIATAERKTHAEVPNHVHTVSTHDSSAPGRWPSLSTSDHTATSRSDGACLQEMQSDVCPQGRKDKAREKL